MKNNKIITISGQPVTGKGTTVKALVKKLAKQGYPKENIHIISTGHEFRNYFNAIFEFVTKYKKPEQMESFKQNEYLKTLLEKQENRDVLINTIIELMQNGIDVNSLTIENANNLKEFSTLRKTVDTIIDTSIAQKGVEINSKENQNEIWIIDSRLAFNNIPDAFSIRLTATPEVAAQRLFNDTTRGKEDNYSSIEAAFEAREKRRLGEQQRYIQTYGIDLENEENYDLIIDTSYSTTEDISDTILTCLECYNNEQPFTKRWASPKTFLPLQRELDTLQSGDSLMNFEEIDKLIKKYGYFPESAIETIEVDRVRYIINGHHRNFSQAQNKKTLIPYEVLAKDDEIMPEQYRTNPTETARNRTRTAQNSFLYGHEWLIEDDFSYNEIYPGIYEKIRKIEEKEETR